MARALLALSIMDAERKTEWPDEKWIDRHWNGYSDATRAAWLKDAQLVLQYIR